MHLCYYGLLVTKSCGIFSVRLHAWNHPRSSISRNRDLGGIFALLTVRISTLVGMFDSVGNRNACKYLPRLEATGAMALDARMVRTVRRQLVRTRDNPRAPLTPASRPRSRQVRPRCILATIFARNTFRHDRWEFSAFPPRRCCSEPAKDSRSYRPRGTSNNLGPRTIPVISLPFRHPIVSCLPADCQHRFFRPFRSSFLQPLSVIRYRSLSQPRVPSFTMLLTLWRLSASNRPRRRPRYPSLFHYTLH